MRRPWRSELSGTATAAMVKAITPKPRLNQKIARQLEKPTSAPPITGPSASARPETAAQTPSASARVPLVRVHVADDRQRPWLARRGTDAHDDAPDDQPIDVDGGRCHDRPGAEHRDAGQHDPLAPEQVTQHPRRQHEAGEGQGVAVDHPLQRGDAGVQVALHVGQPDADDGVVEERQEQDGTQRRQRDRLGRRAEAPLLDGEARGQPVDSPARRPLGRQHRAVPGARHWSLDWFRIGIGVLPTRPAGTGTTDGCRPSEGRGRVSDDLRLGRHPVIDRRTRRGGEDARRAAAAGACG